MSWKGAFPERCKRIRYYQVSRNEMSLDSCALTVRFAVILSCTLSLWHRERLISAHSDIKSDMKNKCFSLQKVSCFSVETDNWFDEHCIVSPWGHLIIMCYILPPKSPAPQTLNYFGIVLWVLSVCASSWSGCRQRWGFIAKFKIYFAIFSLLSVVFFSVAKRLKILPHLEWAFGCVEACLWTNLRLEVLISRDRSD